MIISKSHLNAQSWISGFIRRIKGCATIPMLARFIQICPRRHLDKTGNGHPRSHFFICMVDTIRSAESANDWLVGGSNAQSNSAVVRSADNLIRIRINRRPAIEKRKKSVSPPAAGIRLSAWEIIGNQQMTTNAQCSRKNQQISWEY